MDLLTSFPDKILGPSVLWDTLLLGKFLFGIPVDIVWYSCGYLGWYACGDTWLRRIEFAGRVRFGRSLLYNVGRMPNLSTWMQSCRLQSHFQLRKDNPPLWIPGAS
jgi:hypothetical protein